MSFQHQVMGFAAFAVAAAVFVPGMFGTNAEYKAQDANVKISRADENAKETETRVKPSILGSRGEDDVKRKRKVFRGCDTNGDLEVSNCGLSTQRYASRKKTREIKRSKSGRSIRVAADERGHFQINARMNGRRVPVLVDTGATSIAINQKTARRLGISLRSEDFKHEAQTANGVTKFASTKIREVRVGSIVLDDVDAVVLSDEALATTLLGMSFLKRLTKYSVEGGELKLTQ